MTIVIPPTVISYKGADADDNRLELGQLGLSMQGAAKLFGAAANLAATGQYAERSPTFAVRVMASAPQGGSVTIVVDFSSVAPRGPPPTHHRGRFHRRRETSRRGHRELRHR